MERSVAYCGEGNQALAWPDTPARTLALEAETFGFVSETLALILARFIFRRWPSRRAIFYLTRKERR